ncbi:MAG TPA: methyltransferase domain-containing protein [Saprospiraceae bacterium]|nr:methyltransferase domain-containing protein [Saprospiraceae bacterium]HMQ81983.1 methyltransferase domain-containing protein [Saprospiraceae bacterium]
MSAQNNISLFPPHLNAVAGALQAIFRDGDFADKVIEKVLKADPRRGARDRAFIAENTYEIVRWYRLLYTLRGKEPIHQEDWWEIIGIRFIIAGYTLPNWKEFRHLDVPQILATYQEVQATRAINQSIPDWMDQIGVDELKEDWPNTIQALNQPAKAVLRANTLKGTAHELQIRLKQEDIGTEILKGDALLVPEHKSLFRSKAFQDGYFELQDFSSQQVAPFCETEPGMRVIDACAGAGGKTLHLGSLMQNKGQIIALDTEEWKLHELKKRARRNGIHIIETRPIENTKTIKRLDASADRLLLDVPCTGLGVLRRNPDAKWKLSPDFLQRIKATQQQILSRYARMLKPGGKMVYATCSVLPSENQEQVSRFLRSEAGKGFRLEEQKIILPQDEGFDGFFMARMIRNKA